MGVSTQSTWGSHLHTISIFLNQLNTKHTSKHSTSNQSSCLTQHARDSASRPRRSSLLKARSPPDKSSARTSLVLEIRLLPQSSQAATSQPPKRLVTASEAPATVLKRRVVVCSTVSPRPSLIPSTLSLARPRTPPRRTICRFSYRYPPHLRFSQIDDG